MKTNKCKRWKLSHGNSVWGVIVVPLLALAFCTSASAAVHYVDANSENPTLPYTNWVTAARVIQDAVDAATPGDEIVVTNGLYDTGGQAAGTNLEGPNSLVNRVAVDKPLTLRSVNGPEVTIIEGYQVPGMTNGDGAIRCVYLADGASLSGFTLTNGATHGWATYESDGGGVWCESTNALVSYCVIAGNTASEVGGGAYGGTFHCCTLNGNSAYGGGGVANSTLNSCTITGNSSQYSGGGAWGATLNNCTVSGNSGSAGGGASYCEVNNCTLMGNSAWYCGGGAHGGRLRNCTVAANSAALFDGGVSWSDFGGPAELRNCIVYSNSAPNSPNYSIAIFAYSCTTPMPTNGIGNIANAPLFVDAAMNNYRLRSDSPCINAGSNDDAVGTRDLDGNPRIMGGTVDIGAYEFQGGPGWQPGITSQPQSVAALAATTATFRVNGTGLTPFSYQWQLDGSDVLNATNATLIVSNVGLTELGGYTVIVRNSWGETTSQPAWLKLARWSELVAFDASISMSNWSNGKSWVEWFAERACLSAAGQVKNYSTGGATCADVSAQISRYLSSNSPGSNTLISPWWAGMASDLLWRYRPVSEVISNYSANLTQLARGGGKVFLLPILVPLYLNPGLDSPYARSLDYQDINVRMDREIDTIKRDYALTVFRFDLPALYANVATNPGVYGFTNLTQAARNFCPPGDANKFMWWDGVHPTTAFHHIISDAIYACLTSPLILASPSATAVGTVQVQWHGGSGPFQLQWCADPVTGAWQSGELGFATNATVTSSAPWQFFRVRQLGQ